MIISSFLIDDALRMVPIEPDKAAEACQTPDARVWIDLSDPGPVELQDWLDKLTVTTLSRQLCLEARDRAGFYPLKNEIILVIPFLQADTTDGYDVDYLALVCRQNLLLTIHRAPVLTPQRRIEIEESRDWLGERSIAGLVSAVTIDLSQDCLRRQEDVRNSIVALEDRMDREPDTVEADEIMELRSEVLTLGAVVSDQLPSVQALRATDKPFFKLTDAQDYLNCTLANLQAADRSLDWLDGRIGALRSGFQMHAQDKTNRRLNLLTILSAIFNPATLMAGIWGMNFATMPELSYPFGYPIALGLMALIGSGMYFFFRKNGWFD